MQQLNDRFLYHKNIISGFKMYIKSSSFNEKKLKDLFEFYSTVVNDFDRVKSKKSYIMESYYLDRLIVIFQ